MRQIRRTDEQGMVAIIITLIMLMVISLIVLGFAQVSRRSQREALDNQLALQAYYAAETGVNDITSGLATGLPADRTDCGTFPYNGHTLPRPLKVGSDPTHPEVANTCLLIEGHPPKLIADDIPDTKGSVMWEVKNVAGSDFTSLKLSWEADPGAAGPCTVAYNVYPSADAASWACDHALLRMDIIRASDVNAHLNSATDRDAAKKLAAATATLYLHPSNAPRDVSIDNFTSSTTAYQGACQVRSPGPGIPSCAVTVTLNGSGPAGAQANDYYVRLTALYADAKTVTLSGTDSTGGTPRFEDGQIVIDSTGRAQDQVKRISVRIPLTKASTSEPVFGLQGAGSICKDLMINQPGVYRVGNCAGIWPGI
jgi:hypothetical protein